MNKNSTQHIALSGPKNNRAREPWLYVILAGQCLLNVAFLGYRVLWLDEAYSAVMARLPLTGVPQALRYDAGPPFYYWLLHGWRGVFGESEYALRGLSLLFALLATVCVYRIAALVWSRRAAWISALLFACSPLVTAYSQEARNYTFFATLCLIYALGSILYVFRSNWKGLPIASLSLAVMLYTHNVAWFLALAGGLASLIFLSDLKRSLKLFALMAVPVLLYLPWIPVLLQQMRNTELTIGWVTNAWTPMAILHSFIVFIPGGTSPVWVNLPSWPAWVQIVNAFLVLPVIAIGLILSVKKKQWETGFIAILFILGLVGPYLYSFVFTPVYLAGRTDFCLFPFWYLLIGFGIARLPSVQLRWALIFVLFVQSMFLNYQFLISEEARSEIDVVNYISTRGKPGDVVLCTGLVRPQLEYYLKPKGFQFVSFPLDMERHLAHFNEVWYLKNTDLKHETNTALERADRLAGNDGQIWVAGCDRKVNQPLFAMLRDDYGTIFSNRIETPRMGLRKLNEPFFILKVTNDKRMPPTEYQ